MGHNYEYYSDIYNSVPYMRYGPFEITTFLMSCFIGVAILFSFACAIGYLADLAEEFPTRTRKILHTMILFALAIHTFILILDRLSWWRSLVSIITNLLYLRILANFPRIPSTQPFAIAAIVALLLEMLSWYTFFALYSNVNMSIGVSRIISFVTFILLVPIGFLVTLEVEPVILPGSGISDRTPSSSPHHADLSSDGRKVTVFKALKSWFMISRE
ncbi:Transmembrane adaptor Erv26 [Trypanosoma melophagium]|uniref:Transmembrane adaptor Erv26 n=1 Tax=Trypanosoma melophagium TaxID=715481 RepID=UPI00351A7C64|nr:Transmembrane adaptor Erv26 [Trypanosoma melophagium]